MNKSAPRLVRAFRATTLAMGSPAATGAATDAQTSRHCLPTTNQASLSCRAKSRYLWFDRHNFASFHKTDRFSQQQFAVRGCCFISREFDQVTTAQEIFEQCLFLSRERRDFCQRGQKFDRSLSRCRQPVLLRHVFSQNVGYTDAKLIWAHLFNVAANSVELFQGYLARQLRRYRRFAALRN